MNNINTIVENFYKHGNFKDKNDVLVLLMNLKKCIEFNATIDWSKVYKELGILYKDPKPYYWASNYTPDPIDAHYINDTNVIVFGSNTEGMHDGGAAKFALEHAGAEYGTAYGRQGNSYAICTIDLQLGKRSVPLIEIEEQIDNFFEYALDRQGITFWMTKIGCGITGWNIADIGELFANKVIPQNVVLPIEFACPILWNKYLYSDHHKTFYNIKDSDTLISCNTLKNIISEQKNVDNYYSTIYGLIPEDAVICDEDEWKSANSTVIARLYDERK